MGSSESTSARLEQKECGLQRICGRDWARLTCGKGKGIKARTVDYSRDVAEIWREILGREKFESIPKIQAVFSAEYCEKFLMQDRRAFGENSADLESVISIVICSFSLKAALEFLTRLLNIEITEKFDHGIGFWRFMFSRDIVISVFHPLLLSNFESEWKSAIAVADIKFILLGSAEELFSISRHNHSFFLMEQKSQWAIAVDTETCKNTSILDKAILEISKFLTRMNIAPPENVFLLQKSQNQELSIQELKVFAHLNILNQNPLNPRKLVAFSKLLSTTPFDKKLLILVASEIVAFFCHEIMESLAQSRESEILNFPLTLIRLILYLGELYGKSSSFLEARKLVILLLRNAFHGELLWILKICSASLFHGTLLDDSELHKLIEQTLVIGCVTIQALNLNLDLNCEAKLMYWLTIFWDEVKDLENFSHSMPSTRNLVFSLINAKSL